jgi:hypothetical protein
MSLMEISEEFVSLIDINTEMNETGVSVSVYIDDEEFYSEIDWRDVGLDIAEDVDTYPNHVAKAIAKKMRIVSDYLLESIANGR